MNITKIDENLLSEIVKKVLYENEKQQKEKSKKRKDKRLRNTDLLLRNYNNLMTHIKYALEDDKKLSEEDPENVLNEIEQSVDLDIEDEYEEIYINAIKRTRTRTKIIVNHIEVAIAFYKQKSMISNSYNDKRRYEVIYKYYFEKKNISAIAEELECSDKTVSRDKKRAIEELSVLFFGIDGLKFHI